jgi:hypothetical protein
LEAITGDFTKQDVVNWIDKQYPGMDARSRKESVYTTIAKFRGPMHIRTVREGQGAEPFVYRKELKGAKHQPN